MGTQYIGVTAPQRRRRRYSFRRLFVWYCIGIVGATLGLTCVLEMTLFIWVGLAVAHNIPWTHNLPLQMTTVLLIVAVPCIALMAAIFFFAWLMGRKIGRPVGELMSAVEKIRQQDLNFTIRYDANNELGELCGAFNELRRELQESLEREWRKQEEMRTMIAALSHDLRTPVTIIQGHIEGLARAEAGEKRNERLERYLPVLESSSQRMTRLLNDILLVSALEQTSFVIQPRPVRLEEELERKAQIYSLQAAAREQTFTYTYSNRNAACNPILLDLHRIEQVLDNLFENATHYTPAGGHINLTCTRYSHALVFVLRDTGCGIAPEDAPHIFEKFYHGRARPGGVVHKAAGLGLYTSKLLVERHGGTIRLQNGASGGGEAIVSLPIRSA